MPEPEDETAFRGVEDMDSRLRETTDDAVPRLFRPLTGVPNTPDENRVYEYGRLLAISFFRGMNEEQLEQARRRLRIETGEQETVARNVSVVYRYIEYQNRRDYQGIIDIHHDPYINKTYFGRSPISPAAQVRSVKGFSRAHADNTLEANKIIVATDSKVVVRTTARGTQIRSWPGSMMGNAGKQWAVSLIHVLGMADGRIASYESLSPFENQWEEPFINSNFPGLGGDVSEVRARQGVNADFEYLAEQVTGDDPVGRLYGLGEEVEGAEPRPAQDNILDMIRRLEQHTVRQCQALITPKLRRCAKVRVGDSLYCNWHQEHGFGIDDE